MHRSPTCPQVGFLHRGPVFGSRSAERSGYFFAIHFSVMNLFVKTRFPCFFVSGLVCRRSHSLACHTLLPMHHKS